jgi:gamma-glutamyltranspeptidase/glutathione hydrolase
LAAEFLDENGKIKNEGDVVTNADLSQTLSAIRASGQGGFYNGAIAQKIADYSVAQEGAISLADLQSYRVNRAQPLPLAVRNDIVILPSAETGAGAFSRALLGQLVDASGTPLFRPDALVAGVAQATRTLLSKFSIASSPQDTGATGFAAVDDSGEAVACAVTMNGAFGSDRTAAGTGVTFANASSKSGQAATFLTPLIATQGGAVLFAGAGAGGANSTAAIVYSMINESTAGSGLRATGLEPLDTVNAITCSKTGCAAFADPKASGLALGSTTPH